MTHSKRISRFLLAVVLVISIGEAGARAGSPESESESRLDTRELIGSLSLIASPFAVISAIPLEDSALREMARDERQWRKIYGKKLLTRTEMKSLGKNGGPYAAGIALATFGFEELLRAQKKDREMLFSDRVEKPTREISSGDVDAKGASDQSAGGAAH